MPLRMGLNVCYALLVDGLDSEQRQDLDSRIYGWGEKNESANRRLQHEMMSGGED